MAQLTPLQLMPDVATVCPSHDTRGARAVDLPLSAIASCGTVGHPDQMGKQLQTDACGRRVYKTSGARPLKLSSSSPLITRRLDILRHNTTWQTIPYLQLHCNR